MILFERYYKKLRELKYNFIIVKGSPEAAVAAGCGDD
jgi:hypothetical protein